MTDLNTRFLASDVKYIEVGRKKTAAAERVNMVAERAAHLTTRQGQNARSTVGSASVSLRQSSCPLAKPRALRLTQGTPAIL